MYGVPASVIAKWKLWCIYIGQGELLAGPPAMQIYTDRPAHRNITWYIDNASAARAMIKGSSPTEDSSAIALIAGLQAAAHSCRIWVEYIDS